MKEHQYFWTPCVANPFGQELSLIPQYFAHKYKAQDFASILQDRIPVKLF